MSSKQRKVDYSFLKRINEYQDIEHLAKKEAQGELSGKEKEIFEEKLRKQRIQKGQENLYSKSDLKIVLISSVVFIGIIVLMSALDAKYNFIIPFGEKILNLMLKQ